MEHVFDITAFGAVGDGAADCTVAIQQAIDAAAQVKGAVVVPPGRYLCGYIKLKPSVSLVGYHGWGYRETGGSVLILKDATAPCLLDMTGAHGACVKGIQFLGNQLLGKGIHGIMLCWEDYNGGTFGAEEGDANPCLEPTHASFREDHFLIADCQCKNFSGDGIHLNHVFGFTVCDCQMMSNGGDGIFINGWDGWIHDCIMHTNQGAGIGSRLRLGMERVTCCSVTVTGNRIEWNGGGGIVLEDGDSLNINNNFFDRSYGPAVYLKGAAPYSIRDITVVGNIFRRSGKPGAVPFIDPYENSHVYMRHCENVAVSSNVCRYGQDDGDTGVFSPAYGVVGVALQSCVISANALHKGALRAQFVLKAAEDTIVQHNAE